MKPIKTNQGMAGFLISFEVTIVCCLLVGLWCLLSNVLDTTLPLILNSTLLNNYVGLGGVLNGCL